MKVVFRKFADGEVIALFCHTEKHCSPGYVQSYMHVGQHGEAYRWIGRYIKRAAREEYEPLQRELEQIYKTKIIPCKRLVA